MAKYSLYKLLRKNVGNMLFLKYKINIDFLPLKVVSIKNQVGSKMVLLRGYRPQTVALDIFLLFYFAFILFLPNLRFRQEVPKL
jgi:hypothetical protein